MATSEDFIEFVCDQLAGMGAVRSRKMFGEYMVYVNNKPLLLVCDSTVFVKMLPELAEVLAGAEIALPYEGRQAPLCSGHGKPGTGSDGRRDSRADHAAAQAEREQRHIKTHRPR
jgi:hypothetical protein